MVCIWPQRDPYKSLLLWLVMYQECAYMISRIYGTQDETPFGLPGLEVFHVHTDIT